MSDLAVQLGIPRRHRGVLQRLAKLDSGEWERLISGIRSLEALPSPDAITDSLEEVLGPEDSDSLTGSLIALEDIRSSENLDSADISLAVSKSLDLELTEGERLALKKRLEALASEGAVAATSKATAIGTFYETVFQSCRVITDLRPIFDDAADHDPSPIGALIRHLLRVDVFQGGKFETIQIALNEEDVQSLSSAIERANRKAAGLKSWMTSVGLSEVP